MRIVALPPPSAADGKNDVLASRAGGAPECTTHVYDCREPMEAAGGEPQRVGDCDRARFVSNTMLSHISH